MLYDRNDYNTISDHPSAPSDIVSETKTERRTGFLFGNALAEQVHEPATGKSQFEVAFKGGERLVVPELRPSCADLLIEPLDSEMIAKERLLLPSGSRAYGSTASLVAEIREHVRKYVVLPPDDENLVVYYVLYTWLFDRFDTAPYLRLIGDLGTGKSRVLQVIGDLCYKAFKAGGSSTMSPVFRCLEDFGGCTLCMDELDFYARNEAHQEMMNMLRQGFQRGLGVLRSDRVGDSFQARHYDVYGPKVLAGRKNFPEAALESRCIRIYMQTGARLGSVPIQLPPEYDASKLELRNKLLGWRFDHYFKPLNPVVALPIEPRLTQVYDPIARVIDDPLALAALRGTMLTLQSEMTEARSSSFEGRVLKSALERHRQNGGPGPVKVRIKDVADEVAKSGGTLRSPNPRGVAAACRGLGLVVRKDSEGSYVRFDPQQATEALERYGLAA